MANRCSAHVYSSHSASGHSCQRDATVERDGKWYCWQHDPVREAEEREKRDAEWNMKWDVQNRIRERQAHVAKCHPVLVAALEKVIDVASINTSSGMFELPPNVILECHLALMSAKGK